MPQERPERRGRSTAPFSRAKGGRGLRGAVAALRARGQSTGRTNPRESPVPNRGTRTYFESVAFLATPASHGVGGGARAHAESSGARGSPPQTQPRAKAVSRDAVPWERKGRPHVAQGTKAAMRRGVLGVPGGDAKQSPGGVCAAHRCAIREGGRCRGRVKPDGRVCTRHRAALPPIRSREAAGGRGGSAEAWAATGAPLPRSGSPSGAAAPPRAG